MIRPFLPIETIEVHRISNKIEDRVWIVPGAAHINGYSTNTDAYFRRASEVFERHMT